MPPSVVGRPECVAETRKVGLTGFLRFGSAHELADCWVLLANSATPPENVCTDRCVDTLSSRVPKEKVSLRPV